MSGGVELHLSLAILVEQMKLHAVSLALSLLGRSGTANTAGPAKDILP